MWDRSVTSLKLTVNREIQDTKVTLCGCTRESPASKFPSPNTPDECLATSKVSFPSKPLLVKRAQVFSTFVENLLFTCNTDRNVNNPTDNDGNPYQDCINALTYYCKPEKLASDPRKFVPICKERADQMFNSLGRPWIQWRYSCANWPLVTKSSLVNSSCQAASNNLLKNAVYYVGNEKYSVPYALIESADYYLWSNTYLQKSFRF
jgi:hypothetical protein